MPQLPLLVVRDALLIGLVVATGLVAVRVLGRRRGLMIAAVSVAAWFGAIRAMIPGARTPASHPTACTRGDAPAPRCPGLGLPIELGLDETLAAARACGNHPKEVEALVLLGAYDEAARLVVSATDDPGLATVANLGAGRWRDAAIAVRRRADASFGEDAVEMRCFGDYLDARAGDRAALERLANQDVEACQLMKAIASGEPPAAQNMFYLPAFDLARLLGPSARGRRLFVEPPEPLVATWLGPLATPTDDPIRSEYLANLRASRDIVVGDFPAAATELRDEPGSDDRKRFAARRGLRVELALRTGAPLPAQVAGLEPHEGEAIRRGHATDPTARLEAYEAGCELAGPVQEAIAVDGASLGRALHDCTLEWRTVAPVLPAIVARVTTHREELAVGLRHVRNFETDPTRPFQFLDDYALYRDLARLVGDEEDAARWQARISRHAAMLADRDHVIAFAIWQSLLPTFGLNAGRDREPAHAPPRVR